MLAVGAEGQMENAAILVTLVLSVNNDVIDPGVLNMGESLTVRIRLFPAVGIGTSNWLQLTTELGISASSFFTY